MPEMPPAESGISPNESGLRQRQKKRRRQEIIDAGKILLLQEGYSATSMEAIAEKADVGVATVYNYFGSKAQLLAEIFKQEFDDLFAKGDEYLRDVSDDPVTGVLELIGVYCKFQGNWGKKDTLLAVLGPGLSADPILDEITSNADESVKTQVEKILTHYQNQILVRSNINVTDAAAIIFYIFNQHFMEYVTQNDAEYDEMVWEMKRQIGFIVSALLYYS